MSAQEMEMRENVCSVRVSGAGRAGAVLRVILSGRKQCPPYQCSQEHFFPSW